MGKLVRKLPCGVCGSNLFEQGKATSGGIRCKHCGQLTKTKKDDMQCQEFMFERRKQMEKAKRSDNGRKN